MASTGLFGPYAFTEVNISLHVAQKGAGVYVLDKTAVGDFKVAYVGRSDDDLPGRMRKWLGEGYQYFKYGYFQSAQAAFNRECQIYHDFGPPDNTIHPARPAGLNCKCPVAGCRDLD